MKAEYGKAIKLYQKENMKISEKMDGPLIQLLLRA
jgi:hypothetical protein